MPPTAWLDWCWRAYLPPGVDAAAAAMGACEPENWRALDAPPPPAVVVLSTGDPLYDAGAEVAETLDRSGGDVTVVTARSNHCTHPYFDKAASKRALDAYANLVFAPGS